MYYKTELDYLLRVLAKLHIQAQLVRPDVTPEHQLDLGLRHFLGLDDIAAGSFQQAKENTIYRLSDSFRCHYLFFLLPGLPTAQGLLAGPYTTDEITREELLELAERFRVPAWRQPMLESCFADIPLIRDQTPIITMFSTLGEVLWGSSDAFEIVDVAQELSGTPTLLQEQKSDGSEDDILYRMKAMETRYAYENELMDMVAQGRHHRAELMLSSFSQLAFEQRAADPVRNLKNYAIICNTLLRKAAERGGVHPIYLDSTSSQFARRIESLAGMERGRALMSEMVRTYCRLVRKHNEGNYSAPVQKAVACIEADLSGDLSLRALAAAQNLSIGYLSALFHKETGKTLTEFVTERRLETGARLLRTTRLQVQTVAQHCGISDVNYFSKLFKKNYGQTPKQYRESAAAGHRPSAGQ